MSQVNDPFFDQEVLPYKVIPNPNNPEDKRICLLVQDASPFDGAVIQYTRFKLSDQINLDESIDCQYEYDFEIPPSDMSEVSDDEGDEFERRLGEWIIEILQMKMESNAKSRKFDSAESVTE